MLNLNCVICAELMSATDEVHATKCGHMFHFLCLAQWLERSKSCPQCRNKCTSSNTFRIYFNLANLDNVDIGSLHEQLDNANLKLKMITSDLQKGEHKILKLKETRKKNIKTISNLESDLKKKNFILLSYSEQLKLNKDKAKTIDDMQKLITKLNREIEMMKGVSALLISNGAETEKLLKTENDPKKLCTWLSTLKRELQICESKKNSIENMLKVVQNNLRKESESKRVLEERILQLESENYQLNEKVKALQDPAEDRAATISISKNISKKFDKDITLTSPTCGTNSAKSDSPYFHIKSSNIGMVPPFKQSRLAMDMNVKSSAPSAATSSRLYGFGLNTSQSTDFSNAATSTNFSNGLREKYSKLKKFSEHKYSAHNNLIFNHFGGSESTNPSIEGKPPSEEESSDSLQRTASTYSHKRKGFRNLDGRSK